MQKRTIVLVGVGILGVAVLTCLALYLTYGDDCPCHHAYYYLTGYHPQ